MNVTNPLGLVFAFTRRGALQGIEAGPVRISLTAPTASSAWGANLYLRVRGAEAGYTPLLGPASPSLFRVTGDVFEARGSFRGLAYTCRLQPAHGARAWLWQVQVVNRSDRALELDVMYAQDVGLKAGGGGLVNEAYVSQYLERRVFEDPRYGSVVCCRQNMKEAGGHPWLMLACTGGAIAASTDGAQLYGRTFRATGEPEALRADRLGGERAGESSIVALQARPFVLAAEASETVAFVGVYEPDHAAASSEADLARLPELVRTFADAPVPAASGDFRAPTRDPLDGLRPFASDDLSPAALQQEYGEDRRHIEHAEGRVLSFFTEGPRHVVLAAKETRVDRPHGHIIQAHVTHVPDERVMSTTAFACGVFNAHLTQGNTNFNTFLSVCTNPVVPVLEAGQRIVVWIDDEPQLLALPSVFEMGLNHCRWLYVSERFAIRVRTWTSPESPCVSLDVTVERGGPLRMTILQYLDPQSGWTLAPGAAHELIATPRGDSMLATRFPGGRFRVVVNSRDATYAARGDGTHGSFALDVAATRAFCMSFVGELVAPSEAAPFADANSRFRDDTARAAEAWRAHSRGLTLGGSDAIGPIREILPWYGMNALVHFATPYGLEQFSGAAWGTRDVCQGPIDLLLCEEKYAEAKEVLRTIFAHQNPDGGWPQWWMFDRYASVRADEAHGDVVYWTILALCGYVRASSDFAILDEVVPYHQAEGDDPLPPASVAAHIDRVLDLVVRSFVPGTALVQFGGGDWNDSLQPVSKDLAQRMISSWTVQMSYQACDEYREVLERAGNHEKARELGALAARILADFHRHLVRDGVVAGYGLVTKEGGIDVLLHPSDTTTGVRYSLLPMNRGVISGVFTEAQAAHHAALIEQHLKGPDGARLMDRPLRYRGGPQTIFQRAESSTFFGREIGLMYMHEHLRYAESQARRGKADALLHALRQASPIDYAEVVPQGTARQANCYYSSSDVVFGTRYDADTHYADVIAGALPLEGGWRVYSSGPGIFVAMIVSRLLGLRIAFGELVIDPVLTRSLDGLEATVRLRGHDVTFVHHVAGEGFGPASVVVNGQPVATTREENRYRRGGAVLPLARFLSLLGPGENRVDVHV
ncbi:MAG: hypothetical protein ABW252_08605 [Polyangiales bacterium]